MKKQDGTISRGALKLLYSAISDKGRIRKENEDDFLVMEKSLLFCVADGMGGQEAGRLASRLALESIAKCMNFINDSAEATIPYGLTKEMLEKPLLAAITEFANYQVNKKSAGRTMGSTLVAAQFTDNVFNIAHVGDSRLYLWRGDRLSQVTEDHSLVFELYKMGKISRKEMATHQMRNVITRAIGTNSSVEPALDHVAVQAGDIYLLCSDGLTTMVDDDNMSLLFQQERDISLLAQRFINQANEAGGRDNITVLLISVQIP